VPAPRHSSQKKVRPRGLMRNEVTQLEGLETLFVS
jgi:hypothetical protein